MAYGEGVIAVDKKAEEINAMYEKLWRSPITRQRDGGYERTRVDGYESLKRHWIYKDSKRLQKIWNFKENSPAEFGDIIMFATQNDRTEHSQVCLSGFESLFVRTDEEVGE